LRAKSAACTSQYAGRVQVGARALRVFSSLARHDDHRSDAAACISLLLESPRCVKRGDGGMLCVFASQRAANVLYCERVRRKSATSSHRPRPRSVPRRQGWRLPRAWCAAFPHRRRAPRLRRSSRPSPSSSTRGRRRATRVRALARLAPSSLAPRAGRAPRPRGSAQRGSARGPLPCPQAQVLADGAPARAATASFPFRSFLPLFHPARSRLCAIQCVRGRHGPHDEGLAALFGVLLAHVPRVSFRAPPRPPRAPFRRARSPSARHAHSVPRLFFAASAPTPLAARRSSARGTTTRTRAWPTMLRVRGCAARSILTAFPLPRRSAPLLPQHGERAEARGRGV